MTEKVTLLKGSIVSAESMRQHRSTSMGVESVSMTTMSKIPSAFGEGDIIKAVLTLPGVKSVGEASGGFNVRGGSADQNLILFNDNTIYNPSHLFGIFSAFNPDLVEGVELYKSSIPAEYGGRISSVLSVSSKEGDRNKVKGSLGIGVLTSRGHIEGPIGKKTTFIAGGRISYSDWILKLLPKNSAYAGGGANFADANVGVTHRFDDNNSLQLFGYFATDRFSFSGDTTFRYTNYNAALTYRHKADDGSSFKLSVGYPLKQLAGETAIYGFSSILARVLNFLFVPIYTRMLTQVQYGVVTEFMAYIAILQVVLVLGLETGCFRFANKEGEDPRKVYSGALLAVTGLNLAFLACMVAFSDSISAALGYEGYRSLIIYVAAILFCDSITAILFAKLRQEHKAVKFAVFKTIKILTETGANLVLFFVYPAQPDFTYPIMAILVSCVLCLALFIPDILRLKLTWDSGVVKRMLAYSLPLMVAALPGVANDFLDRILFRYFDTSAEAWRASLGVYQAAVKLAVIMNLFIQMFRYAAEPFFFQRAKDKNSKELYAVVMENESAPFLLASIRITTARSVMDAKALRV